jgi:GNAT superfamily N-acetyltransferase
LNIEVSTVAAPSDLSLMASGLGQHASAAGVEPRNAQSLFAMMRDQQGQLIAGLTAITVWGWLHVKELWVAETARGSDIGTRLMSAAECEARNRGCHHSLLDTFDFQARPFYEKLGYTVFGELADFPRGHCRYFMRKDLLPNNAMHATCEDARA